MRELRLPGFPHIRFLFKDESVHPTDSLKHRLARSLFLYALCSGRLRRGQIAVDASSGSTVISEAWFAQRLGIPFIAVMPCSTGISKQREVAAQLCVAEPAGGAFAVGWRTRANDAHATKPTLIEGIGRPRVEPSFLFDVVDDVIEIDDAISIAAAELLHELFGFRYGGSSGTNLAACVQLAARMREHGERRTLPGDPV